MKVLELQLVACFYVNEVLRIQLRWATYIDQGKVEVVKGYPVTLQLDVLD